MKELEEYYLKRLYPFQDGVLNILKELKLPFYLTGGTPLSRTYFNHRYSDDLDLFVNSDRLFEKYVDTFRKKLNNLLSDLNWSIDNQRINKSINYLGLYLVHETIELKVDFVNDVAPHYGDFTYDPILGRIDSLRNILSNKFSAIYRFEPKDIVDIWVICKNYKCNFEEILNEAKNKEAGVDPVSIFEILTTFPLDKLDLIKWRDKPDQEEFKRDISIIADDIFYCRSNSLYD